VQWTWYSAKLLNPFQADLYTVAYLISDYYVFKETAHGPFLILYSKIGSQLVIAGREMRRDVPKFPLGPPRKKIPGIPGITWVGRIRIT
jgi:hypothetical protein